MGYDKMQRQPIKVGLARVSTEDQNCDLQVNALRAYGCDKVFTEDGVSGGIHPHNRAAFKKALACLDEGDIFVVWKMDRLGRSLKGIIDTVDGLRDGGIQFVSLTECVDTTSATGRAFWQFIGIMAELERELIRERTIEGLIAAKARGKKLGRPFALNDKQIEEAHHAIANGTRMIGDLASQYGVSNLTLKRGFGRLGLIC